MTRDLATVGLLTTLVVACGDHPAETAVGAAVRDTVAYACTPVLVPGIDDEGVIDWFVPGPDGLMAWTSEQTVLQVGASADDAITVGRKGEGPGEFTWIANVGWIGNTLWVTDLMQARLQLFDSDGDYLGVRPLPPTSGWRPTPDGSLVSIGSKPLGASGWAVLRMTGDSTMPTADTLFHFPGPEAEIVHVPMKEGGSMMMRQPFDKTAQIVSAADGSRFCGSEPLDGDQVRIRCIDPKGSILRDTVLTLAPVLLDDARWNRMIERYTRGDESVRPMIEPLFNRPAALERVTGLGVDTDGSLWIKRTALGEWPQRWLRLDVCGRVRDTLLITSGHIAHLSGDTLWRRVSDDDGLQSVERCVARQ